MKQDYRTLTWEARFWALVDKGQIGTGCWEWKGHTGPNGYGVYSAGRSLRSDPSKAAHRISYALLRGAIAEGLQLDHLCRVRSCVNPAHLEAVTQQENLRRGHAGRHNAIKTHCAKGHSFEGFNLIVNPKRNGRTYRACRACLYAANAVVRERRKAAGLPAQDRTARRSA